MNKLQFESSPYLQQHASNPVDWFAWGEEAFAKAKLENKPVLVSIGYAACHWCHVMEHESFEDEAVAAYMSEFFVNIKVDREERPDIDHLYMDALQVMTGQGGWPLNMFVTPDKKPFFGGTYFPPKRIYQRASWMETLEAVKQAWALQAKEVETQAEQLIQHLQQVNLQESGTEELPFFKKDFQTIANLLLQQADDVHGGFGLPPKFPQTMSLRFLMQYHHHTNDEKALEHALWSIDNLLAGGIYDQLGGGLARYSTDAEWLAPHFEKMLYDNALFLEALAEAYVIAKDEKYAVAIREILSFCQTELLSKASLYFAAIDADSEGEEGKFYVWQYEEILEAIPNISQDALSYWDISPEGNWEGKNILRRNPKLGANAALSKEIEAAKKVLLDRRKQRVRPLTDTKILLAWNALMASAQIKCGLAIEDELIINEGVGLVQQLLATFYKEGTWFRNFDGHKLSIHATLEDLAYLIKALLLAGEVAIDYTLIVKAKEILDYVNQHFSDEHETFYFFSNKNLEDIIVRKIETYDGALPSVNAVMAENNLLLSKWFEDEKMQARCHRMLRSIHSKAAHYPSSFAYWNTVMLRNVKQKTLVINTPSPTKPFEWNGMQMPDVLIAYTKNSASECLVPLLENQKNDLYLLCTQQACLPAFREKNSLTFKIKMEKMLE